MADREKVFDALRNCVTEPKCKDCPWEDCEQIGCKRVTVPVTLLLDTLKLLKEQQKQRFFVDSDGKITPLPIQKRGHWKQVEEGFTDMMCSECGELALLDLDRDFVLSKYCPNCGARMDEEVEQDG